MIYLKDVSRIKIARFGLSQFKVILVLTFMLLRIPQSYGIENYTNERFFDSSVLVHIKFNDVISGYNVEVFWYPDEYLPGYERLSGGAVFRFKHSVSGEIWSIATDRFFLHAKTLKTIGIYKDNGEVNRDKRFYSKPFFLNYNDWKTISLKKGYYLDNHNSEATFFFEDVNFDSKKELIVIESMAAQRFRDRLAVYNLDHPEKYNQEPYISFDSETKFNFANKTVELNNSGGACLSEYLTYKFNEKKCNFELVQLISYIDFDEKTSESIPCTKFVYTVKPKENGSLLYILKSKTVIRVVD